MKKKLFCITALALVLSLCLGLLPAKTTFAAGKKKSYSVTYQLKGGKNHKKNPKKIPKGKAVALKKPTRKGYTFKGWYENGRKVTKIKGTKNHTLKAKWEKAPMAKAGSMPNPPEPVESKPIKTPEDCYYFETITISFPRIDGVVIPAIPGDRYLHLTEED